MERTWPSGFNDNTAAVRAARNLTFRTWLTWGCYGSKNLQRFLTEKLLEKNHLEFCFLTYFLYGMGIWQVDFVLCCSPYCGCTKAWSVEPRAFHVTLSTAEPAMIMVDARGFSVPFFAVNHLVAWVCCWASRSVLWEQENEMARAVLNSLRVTGGSFCVRGKGSALPLDCSFQEISVPGWLCYCWCREREMNVLASISGLQIQRATRGELTARVRRNM